MVGRLLEDSKKKKKKKNVQGRHWNGLLLISKSGSRHSRWCHDRGGVACAW